jgi:rod shape-determining protein MreD
MPLLMMMITFYWSIYHPERLPFGFLFFAGFFQDIIFDEMLGLSSFILIVFSSLLRRMQKKLIHRGFLTLWSVFCVLIIIFESLRLLISSFSSPYTYLLETVIMQGVISAACYPCIHFLCSGILTIEHDNKRRYAK